MKSLIIYTYPGLPIMTPICWPLALLTIFISAAVTAQTTASALWPLLQYKSSSIQTPYLNVTKMGQTEPGYLFFSPIDLLRGQIYPVIY